MFYSKYGYKVTVAEDEMLKECDWNDWFYGSDGRSLYLMIDKKPFKVTILNLTSNPVVYHVENFRWTLLKDYVQKDIAKIGLVSARVAEIGDTPEMRRGYK